MIKQLPESGFKDIFYNSEATMLIIDVDKPHYTIIDVNNAYLKATNSTRESLVGTSVFGAFPANPSDEDSKNIERTIVSFDTAINTKKPHTLNNYRYDIPVSGTDQFEERWWTTTNTPVLDNDGNVSYLIHSPINVTELHKVTEREQKSQEALKVQQQQLFDTFMQAPVGIAILKGSNFVVDLINPSLCELYGQTPNEMMGKPVFDCIPFAKGQGFEELLSSVSITGVAVKGDGAAVLLMRNAVLETVYVNFVYEPFREQDGNISGVIVIATEVTEMFKGRKLIEEAEERARLAVDAMSLGTYDLDLTTGEIITSVRGANILGFEKPASREEYLAAFHPDDFILRNKAQEVALKTGHLIYEVRVIWPDKSVHWIRLEGKVSYANDGLATRIIGTLLDITEQRKAMEEQRKLITLVDNSVDLMSILNLDGINSYINKAGMNMLGFDDAAHVSRVPISELHDPAHFAQVEREVLPRVMNKGRWEGTMLVRHLKSGEIFPVYNSCIRIDDPVSGVPIAIGAVMRDLRPEIAAKQALADSEQLLRNITSAAPTTLWMSDKAGSVTYVNQTWVDWTGREYAKHLGSGWLNSIYHADRQKVAQKLTGDIVAHGLFEVEFRLNHADGTTHWCILTGQPQYDARNNFSGYIGSCVDITDQKLLQQQKDDFIGIASHELKTPVTSIKAYTQVLEKMLLKKGDLKEAAMIGRMDAQIDRLTSLIGDLLDVTKINAGKLQFNDTEFDFVPMVQDLVEDLQRTTEKHTLIERHAKIGMVYGDKERIGQVISNLITNAIKYSPQADQIVISTTLKGDEVQLCVQDFGIGITQDKLNKVFEQFYRVSGDMQHTFPGLGLGLYISSEIIKREGGKIWVNSQVGKGSTFCFAIPLHGKMP
ncbi:PAS domain-containing sensor histidine kinase [Mucilaginibacter sp. dw_454]|uniref:PAS domain-containing sensor histidine kinase n=1 Tax=Mucilaginibacter sp. dw_454 TaxID=2720079 RepID=UPI001BD5CB23|nr:PAS domain-containing sensor histidine kinase [Mucilaginibacter sp. dw_454]